MSILKFFKPVERPLLLTEELVQNENLRKEVNEQLSECYAVTPKKRRGNYNIVSPSLRAKIGKFASENGTPKTIKHFSELNLKESSVRNLKSKYLKENRKRKLYSDDDEIVELPRSKRGRRLMLGQTLDGRVQELICNIRDSGGIINSRIVRAIAKGVILADDRTLLLENGGTVEITRQWSLSLLKRMNMVKRRGSTTAKKAVDNIEEHRAKFLNQIKELVQKYDIPPQLIINFDHTGVHLLPVSKWTMAEKGSGKVTIVGLDDKREITGVMAGTLSGHTLPPQVIYKGKTDACHAKYNFPKDWDITHTENHWANATTSLRYLDNVIMPYVHEVKEELKDLPLKQKAMIILDFFSAQLTEEFRDKMKKNNLVYVYVPPNCTSELQPMDLSVQKIVKDHMRNKFEEWYAEHIAQKLKQDNDVQVDLGMGVLKPLSAKWLVSAVNYLKSNPEKVYNGFKSAGIADTLNFQFSVS